MNNKKIVIYLFFIISGFFIGCSKNKNENLARNYYQLALVELEDNSNPTLSYRKSLRYVDDAINNSSLPFYKSFKASLLLLLGEYNEAISLYKSLLNLNLDLSALADIKNNYACALAQTGNINEALEIWNQLIVDKNYLTPEVACFNKAKTFILNKDYLSSKEYLLKALSIDQNYVDAHFNLALISFYHLNDLKLANVAIKKALILDPENIRIKDMYNVIINKTEDLA